MSMEQDISIGVRPGEVVAGKYRLERVLGAGGMGVVVSAHHIQLDERVALKFLLPEALSNPEAVARFVREARAAVKIKNEHVARVSDVGQLENGAPYMVMEFLQGGDLAQWLKQNGPLPFEQAVDFVLQACVAVADAHALRIVHRDLKPANLFCVRRSDGQLMIKVLDFGISKTTSPGSSGPGMDMTKTSALMGTPLYMSPEQMRSSRDVDGATDLWALGVILFELMAGKPPFHADSMTELVMKVASDPPPSLRTFRPDAPQGLDAVIGKCLEKDRNKRYRSVGELAVALLPFAPKRANVSVERISGILHAAGLSESAFVLPTISPREVVATGGGSTGTLPPVGRTTIGATRSKSLAIAVGAFASVVVAGAGSVLVLSRKQDARISEPPAAPSAPAAAQASSTPEAASSPTGTVAAQPSASPRDASASASVSASAVVTTAPTPPVRPTATGVAIKGAHAVASPPHAPANAKPNCDPPYTLDGQGRKNWKTECFAK